MNGNDATNDPEFVNSHFESCRQSTISIRSEEIISQICPHEGAGKSTTNFLYLPTVLRLCFIVISIVLVSKLRYSKLLVY